MGGKRKKSAKKVQTKKKPKLPSVFNCPYCGRERSCTVEMQFKRGVGVISCRFCSETYESRIHPMSDPVDVYCAWQDAYEAQLEANATSAPPTSSTAVAVSEVPVPVGDSAGVGGAGGGGGGE